MSDLVIGVDIGLLYKLMLRSRTAENSQQDKTSQRYAAAFSRIRREYKCFPPVSVLPEVSHLQSVDGNKIVCIGPPT
jgi:hypothetical protein